MKKRVALLVLSTILVVGGVLFLYQAAFSAWMSDGPPNDYPRAWRHFAIIYFSYAIALFAAAIVTVIAAFKSPTIFKSKPTIILAVIILMILAWPHIRQFMLVDSCLDQGGAWDDERRICSVDTK